MRIYVKSFTNTHPVQNPAFRWAQELFILFGLFLYIRCSCQLARKLESLVLSDWDAGTVPKDGILAVKVKSLTTLLVSVQTKTSLVLC